MRSKNSLFDKAYRYSIRKTHLGVGSVVVGLFLAGLAAPANQVFAEENSPTPAMQTDENRDVSDVVTEVSNEVTTMDTSNEENQVVTLENDYISRHIVVENGKVRTTAVTNKLTDERIDFLEGSKEFSIQFKPSDGDMAPPAAPSYTPETEDKAGWEVTANSAANVQNEGPASMAIDGNLRTIWHSNYHSGGTGPQRQLPAHVEIVFPEEKELRTFVYVPRQDSGTNGLVKDYNLYIKQGDATEYSLIKTGTITENPRDIQLIDLGELKTGVKAVKFEVVKAQNNQPFAAAAELDISKRTADEIRASYLQKRDEYAKQLEAYQSHFRVSLDKLTLAKNGIEKQVNDEGEKITFTFNPYDYKNVPVTVKYVVELRKDAKFSQGHLLISVPEADRAKLTIDTIDLQSFKLKDDQAYEEFSNQEPIAEMGGFKGFYAGLGQPVYVGSFYTGSEFPTAWNTVDDASKQLFSRYYSGKSLAQLDLDENGNYRTWNTVIGVARSNDYSVVQQDFYHYLATIGQKSYFRKQYNSWFDHMKNITADNIQSSFNEVERGFVNGGVSPLDTFVVDDGWQEIRSMWAFNSKFPNKLYDSSKQVKRFGSEFGLWLGPQGGYGGQTGDMARWLEEHNLGSLHAGVIYIGDKRYTDGLAKLFKNYEEEFGINYWKLDGLLLSPKSRSDANGIGGGYLNMYSMTEAHERWIGLYETIRANATDPDKMWINLTSYIPPSPWFLQWVNSIWMQNAGDVDYQDGVKKREYSHIDFGSDAAEAITYRDDRYEELVKLRKWQLPFANIYNHDPVYGNTAHTSKKQQPGGPARQKINFTTDELRTYLYMLGTRGTGFWEFYYSPSMMDDEKWQVNGEAVKWIEANYDTLKHAVFHGGKPGHGEVYGYSAWDENTGILSIRNPSDTAKSYTVKLDRLIGMRENTAGLHRETVLGDKRHDTADLTNYGDSVTLTLQPYETVIFQYSKEADIKAAEVLTAKANDNRTVVLEFDERVVLTEETHFAVEGHTVSEVHLNPDYRTVVLTLENDLQNREAVTVNYTNVRDNAGTPNVANGQVVVTAYDGGIIEDISAVKPGVPLFNEGIEGKGEFSVTVKAQLGQLNQTLASQKDQWSLAVNDAGQVVFMVKDAQVVSAPFKTLRSDDRGQADKLVTVDKEVVITAVRAKNGSLKLYIDGQLHNTSYDKTKVNEALAKSEVTIGAEHFDGTISRFILENKGRDFETALALFETVSPQPGKVAAPLDSAGTQAPSYDPNDGGPRPAMSATDGDALTYWASSTAKDNRQEPQTLTVALENPSSVSEVRYTPRLVTLRATGDVRKAKLEHSLDGVNWQLVNLTNGNPDGTINFTPGTPYHSILFDTVEAKYFRFTALETYHWRESDRNKIVAVAELTPVVDYIPEVEKASVTLSYLRNILNYAGQIDREPYTEASLANLDHVLSEARMALSSDSQDVVDEHTQRTAAALTALMPREKTFFDNVLSEVGDYDKDGDTDKADVLAWINNQDQSTEAQGSRAHRELIDEPTGVRVILDKGEVGDIVNISVTHIKDKTATVPNVLDRSFYDLFDIQTINASGEKVAVTRKALVVLPVADEEVVEKVIYLPNTNQEERLAFKVISKGDDRGHTQRYVIFEAGHFSNYAIVYRTESQVGAPVYAQELPAYPLDELKQLDSDQVKMESPVGTPNTETMTPSDTLPQTGDASTLATTIFGLSSILAAFGLGKKRRKED